MFPPLYRNVGGDRKEKRAYGIMNTKKKIIYCFRRRKERKGKENVGFLHPALFFITPVYNDPTENEKKKFNGIYTIFETLCFHFENTEFRLSSKHSQVSLFQHSVS